MGGLLEALGLKKAKGTGSGAPTTGAATTPSGGAPTTKATPTTATKTTGSASAPNAVSTNGSGGRARANAMSEAGGGGEAAEKRFQAFAARVDASLDRAWAEIERIVVTSVQDTWVARHRALKDERDAAGRLADRTAAAAKVTQLDSTASTLELEARRAVKDAAEAQQQVADWAQAPMARVKAKYDALAGPVKARFRARFDLLAQRVTQAQGLRDRGEYDKLLTFSGQLFYAWRDLETAIDSFAVEYPKFEALRDKVTAMLDRIKGGGLLDDSGTRSLGDLEAAVQAADAVGRQRGYGAAQAHLNRVVVQGQALRKSNDAYRDYAPEKAKVDRLVAGLKAHAQAKNLGAEIGRIEAGLKRADTLSRGGEGGSLKALTALKTVTQQCAQAQALAAKLAAAEARLPALTAGLEKAGVPKGKVAETARFAVKLLVEENCSEADAVKMAKDARGYADEGLPEADALVSSRVKKSLEDGGVPAEKAKAIGKNVRAAGTATADDAKAMAQSMKHISTQAIEKLTDSGIVSECCRGPVTNAMPDLAGVQPRGWPDTMTWDEVPGVYNGSEKKLVVGTFEKGGKRAVPAAGEGPIPHGASDLYGHEAGHAFDAAKPAGKSGHPAFLAARSAAIADAARNGMVGGRDGGPDDYYMTVDEGGANDAGATSETFAESFAMYFGTSRWKKLDDFWKSNPWGI